jgi:hypothetical protein
MEREGSFVRSKQMQFGDDKKLQPSDIADIEKGGIVSFTGAGGQPGHYGISPYVMDKSGAALAQG